MRARRIPSAPYYLGNLLYDKRRHEEAIALWERSVGNDPAFSTPWRNLGIGYHNIRKDVAAALDAYDKAFAVDPLDARIFYERDQLWKRTGRAPAERLAELEAHPDLVPSARRSVYRADRASQTRPDRRARHFSVFSIASSSHGKGARAWRSSNIPVATSPWGRQALLTGDPDAALAAFEAALTSSDNLGEARHLLANQSDVHYWAGLAASRAGKQAAAKAHWTHAADFRGDFLGMEVRAFSEKTYFSILSMKELGRGREAENRVPCVGGLCAQPARDQSKDRLFRNVAADDV